MAFPGWREPGQIASGLALTAIGGLSRMVRRLRQRALTIVKPFGWQVAWSLVTRPFFGHVQKDFEFHLTGFEPWN